ncbi:MFS transporter [uncultured Arcticibacterium sp.]|uniref:MFS transporter n=1 Tax=uncultured Arcticibacterium sp. TaxID=2173042 RepID=UPI0030F6DC04
MLKKVKPLLGFREIINMNFGFFGLQYSFGLQQANMSPIYSYLGAEEHNLPFLWLAGPMTGLIVQPIIGAISDKTVSKWGRRRPYFFVGAILCSLMLFIMPFSSTVWMAASVLWILDAANNITQEPYRAFVSDKLDKSQHSIGYLSQSAFTGLGQTLSYLTPSILIFFGMSQAAKSDSGIPTTTYIAFLIGSVVSIGSILWSLKTTKEIPLTEEEIKKIKAEKGGVAKTLSEIWEAVKTMPLNMRLMIPMMFFSWYAMFIYWQFITLGLSKTFYGTTDPSTVGFRSSEILTGQIGAFYNFIAFAAAFGMAAVAKRFSPKYLHQVCLILAGLSLFSIPFLGEQWQIFIPMLGLGLAWASMMGNPYIILSNAITSNKTGVYMGIFNLFIVIPMLIETFTFPFIYKNLLKSDPQLALMGAGAFLFIGGVLVSLVKSTSSIKE